MEILDPLNVLFIASEADPYVKVGGLADVAGSLPRALRAISQSSAGDKPGIDIRLVIPYHPRIRKQQYAIRPLVEFPIKSTDQEYIAEVFLLEQPGFPVYLVAGDLIDQETGVYSADLEEDGYKYVFFSLACLELARRLKWRPHILHANDWHTAAAVYSLKRRRSTDRFFAGTASLLTVHNLPYLGSMTAPALESFGLPPADHSDLPSWARQMALPLGLLAADAIVAVSPGYAREILTEELGSGLDTFLRAHSKKLTGILNGLDTQKWDPFTDKAIPSNFSLENMPARAANKAFVQRELGLEIDPRTPLLSMVTRMDPQKGVDLAIDAIRWLLQAPHELDQPIQVILLGTGNPVLENEARQLENQFPASVRARIEFDERLSHLIYAGADILLMPSRYEPCGLSQMIAMHYGCVPIARATGGLCDTIQDPGEIESSTGFLFTPATPEALLLAIQRALANFLQDPDGWSEIQRRGMQQDFSWNKSAQAYLDRYMSLVAARKNV